MNVQQNFHMPLLCTGEDNASISDKNECCQEELGLQSVSGNSKSVRILEEFRRIYLDRLRQIEEETPEEGAELKLKTLTSWVNDLGEQNLMLVETVEQLEREAADRVTLLEERLKKSSHIALEYMSKLEEYDNQFLNQSVEKVHPVVLPIKTSSRLIQAQQTEEILKTRIGNLQNDISGLLELIRRARYDGSWDTNGLSFLEVTYEDIFGLYPHQVTDSVETTDHLQTTISMLQQKLGRALEDNLSKDQEIKLLQENIACQRADIKNLVEKIEELQSSSCGNTKEKKGVSFASPTKEDYRLQVQDLQKALKQVQNGAELARKQVTQHCGCQIDKVALAKHIEECRVNVVLAQAAIEETMEELETVTDILQGREEKIHELETEIQSLLNTLIQSQQDTHFLFKPVTCDEERIFNAGEPFLSYLAKVNTVSELLKSFRNEITVHDEERPTMLSTGLESNTISEGKSFKEISFLLEELSQQEKEVSQRCLQINNFEGELRRLCSAMKGSQKNMEDYHGDKLFPDNWMKNDGDFEKNLLFYEKLRETQLKVIENLQDEIRKLKRENKVLQSDPKKCIFCNSVYDNNCNISTFIEKLRVEIENLKSTISANEKVILHQREMLNIQQEALVMSQEEVKELQNQLKNLNEDFKSKFQEEKVEEHITFNTCSEKQLTELNMSGAIVHFEKPEETEEMCVKNENLNEIANMQQRERNRASPLFINVHLNKLKSLLDAQSLQERKKGQLNCDLPMSYSEAINYCNYIEYEVNKLQDLLIDFQTQMSTFQSEVRRPVDHSDSLMKIANLEMKLSETCKNYESAKRDCCKYQEQLLNAAEREVTQQENFTAEETYWLEKMCQVQAENLRYLDTVNILNEEIELLHSELHERDCQLQNTASALRIISSQSAVLQNELQKQEKNVEELENQLLNNNIKLQKALSYLDMKNKLM